MQKIVFLKSILCFLLVAILTGCANAPMEPDFYPKSGDKYAMHYKDSKTGETKTVYDLRGKWEAKYGLVREVVRIEQDGNKFKGYKTIGNEWVGADEMTIRGIIEGNLIRCEIYNSALGFQGGFIKKIEKDGNSFECTGEDIKKFTRIK